MTTTQLVRPGTTHSLEDHTNHLVIDTETAIIHQITPELSNTSSATSSASMPAIASSNSSSTSTISLVSQPQSNSALATSQLPSQLSPGNPLAQFCSMDGVTSPGHVAAVVETMRRLHSIGHAPTHLNHPKKGSRSKPGSPIETASSTSQISNKDEAKSQKPQLGQPGYVRARASQLNEAHSSSKSSSKSSVSSQARSKPVQNEKPGDKLPPGYVSTQDLHYKGYVTASDSAYTHSNAPSSTSTPANLLSQTPSDPKNKKKPAPYISTKDTEYRFPGYVSASSSKYTETNAPSSASTSSSLASMPQLHIQRKTPVFGPGYVTDSNTSSSVSTSSHPVKPQSHTQSQIPVFGPGYVTDSNTSSSASTSSHAAKPQSHTQSQPPVFGPGYVTDSNTSSAVSSSTSTAPAIPLNDSHNVSLTTAGTHRHPIRMPRSHTRPISLHATSDGPTSPKLVIRQHRSIHIHKPAAKSSTAEKQT